MDIAHKTALDQKALAMVSNTYFFENLKALHPSHKTIGTARVSGVVIHEDAAPELLLLDDSGVPEFYPMTDLRYSYPLAVAV